MDRYAAFQLWMLHQGAPLQSTVIYRTMVGETFNARILIEDDPTTAETIEKSLRMEGFYVYSTDLDEESLTTDEIVKPGLGGRATETADEVIRAPVVHAPMTAV